MCRRRLDPLADQTLHCPDECSPERESQREYPGEAAKARGPRARDPADSTGDARPVSRNRGLGRHPIQQWNGPPSKPAQPPLPLRNVLLTLSGNSLADLLPLPEAVVDGVKRPLAVVAATPVRLLRLVVDEPGIGVGL